MKNMGMVLLYFTYELIKKFKKGEFEVKLDSFANNFMDLRTNLKDMLDNLEEVEKIITEANLTETRSLICECLLIIPQRKVYKMGKNLRIYGQSGKRPVIEPIKPNMIED